MRILTAMALTLASCNAFAQDLTEFPAVVTEILQRQTEGPISAMSDGKKAEVVTCVNDVLTDMPNGKKRYVLEAAEFEERERRFGKVLYDNRAEWMQNIARGCASVALSGGG